MQHIHPFTAIQRLVTRVFPPRRKLKLARDSFEQLAWFDTCESLFELDQKPYFDSETISILLQKKVPAVPDEGGTN
jgi:hypothetical protein